MHERVIYAETFAHGKTALEIEPRGVAAQEVFALWDSVKAKRPPIDLMALTSERAVPMQEAVQRTVATKKEDAQPTQVSPNLEALAFKVPPAFRRRFRHRAATADLKLNELLFEALGAWEREKGLGEP